MSSEQQESDGEGQTTASYPRRARPRRESRKDIFDVATRAMRRSLVEEARRRIRRKGGARDLRIDAVALNEALDELEKVNKLQVRILFLRYFAGMTIEETAEIVGVTRRIVRLDSRMAFAWLRRRLTPDESK